MPNGYSYKVEIEGNDGFILDTDLLDTGLLGYVPTDVTEYVRSVNMKTGRSTIQDKFTAGQLTVVFDNRTRVFDPYYLSSPIYGAVKPRRRIFFTIITNPEIEYPKQVFAGTIDTWSFDYDVSTESTATASASDGFAILANQNLSLTNPASETTYARLYRALTSSSVNWPIENLSGGNDAFTMGTASYSGNALNYVQQLADSERGYVFLDGNGILYFEGWNYFVSPTTLVYFSDSSGTAIPFTNIETNYDTDQFYNYVSVTGYPGTVVAQNTTSQNDYGISAGEFPVLTSGTGQMAYVATHINQKFSDPRFRISNITISLDDPFMLTAPTYQGYTTNIDLLLVQTPGCYVQVSWTPNNVGTPVTQSAFIIGINISATPGSCEVSLSLSGDELRGAYG